MHAGRNYTIKEVLYWTRRAIFKLLLISAVPVVLYQLAGWRWISIPWLPIALIGTAVAFLVGFKNNATYSRLWEARQIWGAIVNSSRSWGMMARDFVGNYTKDNPATEEELNSIRQRLIYRHIAWLTVLRCQLREPRAWENLDKPYNREYLQYNKIPEHSVDIPAELNKLLGEEEAAFILSKKNKAAQLLARQSADLKAIYERGLVDDFRHMEMEKMLADLYIQQGKCERIKNFPYPRQFATINLYFVQLFIILVPFGMVGEFQKLGEHFVWMTIPFSALVCWVFDTMEKIGEATENPFEGTANDVPVTALSRTIEIDLRDMLNEKDLPPALQPVNNILM